MDAKFGTFRSTFKLTSFFLCIAFMYPHPKTNIRRLLGFCFLGFTMMPHLLFVSADIYYFFKHGDILNLIRHTTIMGPFLGGMLKILSTCHTAKEATKLINEMDRDYSLWNNLPGRKKNIIKQAINNSKKYCEKSWAAMVVIAVVIYPVSNIILNANNQFFNDSPRKYMLHEMRLAFLDPQITYGTPFYELFYAYTLYAASVFVLLYIGYDSLFAIIVDHACLKINMYCEDFEDALKIKDNNHRFTRIVNVIQEQLRLFEYVKIIKIHYNIYLGVILFSTLIQIGCCLYHVTESEGLDVQFLAIAIGAIGAIFMPCFYSAKLKEVSLESSVKFYCAGWENVTCIKTRKVIHFMIARAQKPLTLTGFNCELNMELFVAILRAAYSIYTLLCS